MEGFLRYRSWGLIFGGAYTWWGLFSEFYGRPVQPKAFWLAWFSGQITCTWATCPELLNLLFPIWSKAFFQFTLLILE